MSAVRTVRRRLRAARRRLTAASVSRVALVALAAVGAAALVALGLEAALWLGVGLRTALWWGLAGLAAVGAVALVPPLLRGAGLLPGLDERSLAERAEREHPGVGDRLRALLDLADDHAGDAPDALRSAALDRLAQDVDGVPFERLRVWAPARRALAWALVPLALLTGLFLGAPGTFSGAAARLMAPGVVFSRPAPFTLSVEPGDAVVGKGGSLDVAALAAGRELPLQATIEYGRAAETATETARMTADEAERDRSSFAFTLEPVAADLRYRVLAGGVVSPWYTVSAEARPLVRGVRVTVSEPGYSGRGRRTLPEGVGDVTALGGATVRVQVETGGTPAASGWLDVRWADGKRQRVPLRLGSAGGIGQFRLRGPGTYAVRLKARSGALNANPARYALGVLGDGPPQITLVEGADGELSAAPRRLTFRITDDFGFSSAALVWRYAESSARGRSGFRRVGLGARTRPLDQEVRALWRLGARPGDVVEFYGEVRDNDAVRGAKGARTPLFTLRFPSLGDRLDQLDVRRDSVADELGDLRDDAEDTGERLRDLREELRRRPEPDQEDRRQLEQIRREQDQMRDRAGGLEEQMQELSERMRESGMLDPQTQRSLDQMQEVMRQLDSPELRQALERLQDAMEKLDLRDMLQSADEAAREEERFRDRLERAQELLERLETAVELEEAARRAEDLAERQEELARETAEMRGQEPEDGDRRPNTPAERERQAREQEALQPDAEALQEQLDALEERLDDTSGGPSDEMQEMLDEMEASPPSEQMEQSAEQLRQNEMQDAQQSQQQTGEQLRQMAQQMRSESQQMQGQQRQVDQAALRRALEDVLTLSREQEALAGRVAALPSRSAALNPEARRQRDLRAGFRTVIDTLARVATSVPQLDAAVERRADEALRAMDTALASLADRQSGPSAGHGREAMSHLNDLAILLSDVLDQLQNSAQQQGGGGGGSSGQGTPEQMQQMGQAQQRLNAQIQQMLGQTAGERLSRSDQARARQLAEQQEAIRRQLQQMLENGGGTGSGLGPQQRSALQRIEEQMAEAAAELRRGRSDPRAGVRQTQIFQKLLQAERSMNERGQEEKREAEAGRRRPNPNAPRTTPPAEPPAQRVRRDMIRALESGYAPDYQELIKRYFERLRQRAGG